MLGKLAAMSPANPWTQLFTKQLEIEKKIGLAGAGYAYDGHMDVSTLIVSDLD